MKIHIVQKGDTLWELAKKYGVDFEELKQANTQLSSPDMIMPGMKIKIPGTSKSVKKEVVHPYKQMPQQPKPVIAADDHKKKMMVQPQMPQMPPPIEMPIQQMTPVQMPIMEQEMSNYTTINMPAPPPPKEKVKKEVPKKEKKVHYKPMPQPQMPMCCYVMYPCCPPMHHGPWHHAMPMAMPYPHYAPEVFGGYAGPAPMMEMPVKPEYGAKDDCGCHSHGNFHFMHDFREQEQPAPESMNYYPPHAQVDERGYPTPPAYQSFPEDETESGNE